MTWLTPQLREIAAIVGGSTPRRNREEFWGGDILWLTPTDLPAPGSGVVDVSETASLITQEGLDSCSASLLPEGTVLFSSRATIGKVGIAAKPLATNQGFANFLPKKGVDSRYLAYALMFNRDQIAGLAGSTTFKEVSKSSLKTFRIPLPPPSEQRRIVEILDQADALRKKRAEANKIADRILPALFYKMFGDPATNPKGWDAGITGDVIAETQYGTSTKANTNGDGVPVLRMNNIDYAGYLDLSDLKYVVLPSRERSKYMLSKGDILFNRTNSRELVGKTGLWDGGQEAVLASYLIRVRVDTSKALPEYLWAFMNTPYIKALLQGKSRRAIGMANINAKELRSLPFIEPPLTLQKQFSCRLSAVKPLRDKRARGNNALDALFAALLHRAFSGDLTANWREAHMKELLQEMEQQARDLGKGVKA